jgi:catechol 2,3-dioxygenase-like lactoylglutathione lyase family enzyme
LEQASATAAVMRLGAQTLELVQFANAGAPYPAPRAANDPWFQHFAIAVSDVDQVFAQLGRFAAQPISHGGPQRLPPSTGDVTAYKFRDPDGHPLELSQAPKGPWADQSRSPGDQPTLGIDHSALAVADLDASLQFYTFGLGLRLGPPALNQGPEQARLDGLDDPVVDIATLTTAQGGPHLELLHYRRPKSMASPVKLNADDIAATRLVMHTADLDRTTERALAAGATRRSRRIVESETSRTVLLSDPNGHLLQLIAPND